MPNILLECIQHLRQNYPRVRISVELENPAREGLQESAALADVIFYSRLWAKVLAPLVATLHAFL